MKNISVTYVALFSPWWIKKLPACRKVWQWINWWLWLFKGPMEKKSHIWMTSQPCNFAWQLINIPFFVSRIWQHNAWELAFLRPCRNKCSFFTPQLSQIAFHLLAFSHIFMHISLLPTFLICMHTTSYHYSLNVCVKNDPHCCWGCTKTQLVNNIWISS